MIVQGHTQETATTPSRIVRARVKPRNPNEEPNWAGFQKPMHATTACPKGPEPRPAPEHVARLPKLKRGGKLNRNTRVWRATDG